MKTFFSFLFILIIKKASAQLIIKSNLDSLPIANVKITLTNSSTPFFSNTNGHVNMPLNNDSTKIKINFYGYEYTTINVAKNQEIFLQPQIACMENAVVYTGNLNEKKYVKDDIANVKIINANEIKQTASQNLGDVLKFQPNITLTQDAILGTSIAINGMSGQNVKILKNGAAIAGTMNGSVDVSQVNVGNVEQIEIIEGPMSLLYGSNALAGTINILSQLPTKKLGANAKAYTESTGIYNVSASISHKIKNNTGINFYLGRNFFDGWHTDNNFFYNYNAKTNNRYSLWKPRVQLLGDFSLLHKINKNASIKFNSDFLNETIVNKGTPTLPYFESAFDDYYHTLRNINSIELNIKQGKFKHNILGSYTYFKRTKNSYLNDLTEEGKGVLTIPESQDTTAIHTSQLRYVNQYKFNNFSFNTGIDINHEIFNGKRVLNNSQSIYNGSLIAMAGYTKKNKLDVLLGIRQMVHSISKIPLIPSFIVKYHLPKNIQLKYTAAKGYRTPGVKEMYLYFVDINHNILGNENLQSESSINQNFGISQKIKIGKNALLNWQTNTYINQFKQLITLAATNNTGTEYTYINIGKYETKGINTDINYNNKRIVAGFQTALIATSNTEKTKGTPDFFKTINLAIKGSYKFLKNKNLAFNTYINNFGKSPYLAMVNNVAQTLQTQSYTMVDANINYTLKRKNNEFNFAFGLKNINNISNIKTGISTGGAHQNSNGQRLISTGRTIFCSIEIRI